MRIVASETRRRKPDGAGASFVVGSSSRGRLVLLPQIGQVFEDSLADSVYGLMRGEACEVVNDPEIAGVLG